MLTALLAYLSGLLPYIEGIPRNLAYALVLGSLGAAVGMAFWSPRLAAEVRHRARREILLWILVLQQGLVQFLLFLQGDLNSQGTFKVIAYLGVCVTVFVVLTCALERSRRFLWVTLAGAGGLLGVLSLLISLRGKIHILGRSFAAQPWRIPLIGLPPNSSLFEDENYAAVVFFVCLMAALLNLVTTPSRQGRLFSLGAAGMNSAGLLLTHSRAAYLALVVAMVSGYLADLGRLRRLFALGVLLALGLLLGDLLLHSRSANQFLEVHRGMTGRETLWAYVLERIAERPLLGYGVGNVGRVVAAGPGHWVSAHNSFLDFALMFGVPTTLLYLVFLASCLNRLRTLAIDHRERSLLLGTCLGLLVIANFITHTLGGVSFGSLSLGVFLGLPGAIRTQQIRQRAREDV